MDEWGERKRPTCSMATPPVTAVFESITEDLSIRAEHVLANLGVKNAAALLQLTRDDLIQTWSCGKKTIAEIEAIQSKLRTHNEQEVTREFIDALDLDNVPKVIFDTVQSVLSVRGAHVLEDLGVNSLKAFMMLYRKQLLKCCNCGRKTADEILRLQVGIARFTYELAHKSRDFRPEQLLTAPCLMGSKNSKTKTAHTAGIFADVENPAPWLAGLVHSLARSRREAHAFMLRKGMCGFAPMTLELVGKRVGGLSRERVRQIEKAVEKRIAAPHQQNRLRPLIDVTAAMVKQRGGMVGLDELTKALLCRGENGDQLTFAMELIAFFSTLQVWKDADLLLQEDGIVRNEASRNLIRRLAGVVEQIASAAADERDADDIWSIDRKRLKDALQESAAAVSETPTMEKVSDALLDAVLKQCRNRVRAHRDRVYPRGLWQLRFGRVVQMMDAVLKQIGKPAHFSKIAEHARKWRPALSDNNAYATLDRSKNALLWDRGTFIHKDNVVMPLCLIHDVEDWLHEALREDVPFVSIHGAFLHFRNRCKKAALPSETALYTCLRQSAHPELAYPRFPCIYLKKGFMERIPMLLAVEEFLRDAGGLVSQQELREFIMGKIFLKDFQFHQFSKQVPNVIRTTDWGYLHFDNAGLEKESIQMLIQYAQEVLTKVEHCSINKLYRDKRVTCRSAGIDGPVMLYSVLQCFAEELFSLDGYPRVARCHYGQEKSRVTIRKRVLDFIRDSGLPCPYQVLEERFVEQLGYKEQQVYSVVIEAEVCLYHSGCVIHHQTLEWDEAKQHALERAALHIYENAVRAGMCFGRISHLEESSKLPHLPSDLHWSRIMIADLLTKGGRYLVLGNSGEAYLPRENEQDIHNFESLVAKLLHRDWNGAANLVAFEGALVKAGIIKKRLTPAMLGGGRIVVMKNREIILTELLIDA